ncbi:MAG: hypothetical protein GY913_04565 [Proteobacteria bacterium]|nr:hypothetical protein [Pseudomonadota bacterium]MCP4916175.1 hypothetical protein [Pseudomonadota bacterium]
MTLFYLLSACSGAAGEPVPAETDSHPAVDQDGDGYVLDEDCDDTDPDVHPGAQEICNGLDDDCDDTDAIDQGRWYADQDGDFHGAPDAATTACDRPADAVRSGDDCDDSDPAR